jgi:hypothetical protein
MSEPLQAVFLSYASEDAEVAVVFPVCHHTLQ